MLITYLYLCIMNGPCFDGAATYILRTTRGDILRQHQDLSFGLRLHKPDRHFHTWQRCYMRCPKSSRNSQNKLIGLITAIVTKTKTMIWPVSCYALCLRLLGLWNRCHRKPKSSTKHVASLYMTQSAKEYELGLFPRGVSPRHQSG